jgi:hypothetical protein
VLAGKKGTSRHSFTVSQVHRCWPHGRKRFAPHSQVHSFTGSQPIEAVLAENQGEGTREKEVGSKVQRLLLLAASPGIQAERSGATLIVSNIQGRNCDVLNRVYPRGVGGRGGTHFAPYPEHSRMVRAEKNGSKPHLCAHLLSRIRPAVTASPFHSPKHVFLLVGGEGSRAEKLRCRLRLSLFPLSAFDGIRLQIWWKRITHGMRELEIIFSQTS